MSRRPPATPAREPQRRRRIHQPQYRHAVHHSLGIKNPAPAERSPLNRVQHVHGNRVRRDRFQRERELDELLVSLAHPDYSAAANLEAHALRRPQSRQLLLEGVRRAKRRKERRRGLYIAVHPLKPGHLQLRKIGLCEQPERAAKPDLRRLAHLAERFADIIDIFMRKAASRSDDTDPVRTVRLGLLRRLDARLGADPAVCFAAGLPVSGLCAPLAVLGAASRACVYNGAEIESLLDAAQGRRMRALAQLLATLRLQQRNCLLAANPIVFAALARVPRRMCK